MPHRPFVVGLVSILMWIQAATAVIAAIVLIVERNDPQLRLDTDLSTGGIWAVAIWALIWALATAALAWWLWQGSNFVRIFVGFFMVLWIIGGIWALFAFDGQSRTAGLFQAVIAIVVLWGLFGTEKSREFFAQGRV